MRCCVASMNLLLGANFADTAQTRHRRGGPIVFDCRNQQAGHGFCLFVVDQTIDLIRRIL